MAKIGYVVFSVSAHRRYDRDDPRPLDNLDGRGADALYALGAALDQYANAGPQVEERYEQAYRVDAWAGAGRCLLVDGAAGPYGTAGRLVDIDTGDDATYTDRQATMVDLRAMFAFPAESYEGLLFCERRAARHLKNALERGALRSVGAAYDVTFRVSVHADPVAWGAFLDNAQTFKVTYLYRSTRQEDFRPESRSADLAMTASGSIAERVGERFRGLLLSRAGRSVDAIDIDDALSVPEMQPRDEHFRRDRVELQVGDERAKRTIIIEREQLPQFVYELGDRRLAARVLRQHWAEHAEQLLSRIGVTLPEQWAVGRWPDDATSMEMRIAK